MEEPDVDAAAGGTAAQIGDPVSIENIFNDGVDDEKKVIVLQSQETAGNETVGQLPDLSDAVADPGQPQASEVAYDAENVSELITEENHSGSAETVSATETYEEMNSAIDEQGNQADPHFVTEPVQDIQTIQNSEEVVFIDSDQVQDQDIEFIEMRTSEQSVEQPTVVQHVDFQPEQAQMIKREIGRPLRRLSETIQPMQTQPAQSPRKTTFISKDDLKTRFLCPVCEKSFRQKHLLLVHLKLHENPAKAKSNSVYMSNCTTCGGNVRLTSEQARLLQERGTQDARIICSTCKLLGHDVMQPKPQNAGPIELKPAYNFNCDLCGCDIKLTDDQLQLVDRKGPENIRIICAPCSTKDQDQMSSNPECTSCRRTILSSNQESIDLENPMCAECLAKNATEETAAVENMPQEQHADVDELLQYKCMICDKEMYLTAEPQTQSDLICPDCKIPERYKRPAKVSPPTPYLTPTGRVPRFPYIKGIRELKPPDSAKVDGLAVMYKCNSCFCSMQVTEEQKQLLKARGVSGMKIICSACNSKGKSGKKKTAGIYQCDICLNDMDLDYVPSRDDDDIICQACRKAEQRDRLRKGRAGDLFKCITCQKYLPLTNTQMNKILQRNVRPSLQCDICRAKGLDSAPTKVSYRNLAEKVDYRCDICSLNFGSNFDKFADHFERIHIPAKTQLARRIVVRCPICDFSYSDQDKLKTHLRTHKPKKLLQRPCPFCGEKFSKKTMFEHYKNTHSINIENEMYIFKIPDEFKNWKEEIETSTCSKFVCCEKKANVIKNMPTINLRCQWSCLYKSKLVKPRTSVFCPANIELRVTRNGIYTVNFTKTHVGHELLTDDFSLEEIELMKGFLREGKTVDDVVKELCKELSEDSEEYARFYQLKNYDEFCLSLKLGDRDLIKKFKREDDGDDDEEELDGVSDCELKADWVDLPKPLAWLKEESFNVEQVPRDTPVSASAKIDIVSTSEQCSISFRAPSSVEQFPFGQKKMDVLRRMTDLLNKCNSDEHFDILEIYLSPCEQTLTELTSGKRVEVVGDDEMEATSETPHEQTRSDGQAPNDVTQADDQVTPVEETETAVEETHPPVKRLKTESP